MENIHSKMLKMRSVTGFYNDNAGAASLTCRKTQHDAGQKAESGTKLHQAAAQRLRRFFIKQTLVIGSELPEMPESPLHCRVFDGSLF